MIRSQLNPGLGDVLVKVKVTGQCRGTSVRGMCWGNMARRSVREVLCVEEAAGMVTEEFLLLRNVVYHNILQKLNGCKGGGGRMCL